VLIIDTRTSMLRAAIPVNPQQVETGQNPSRIGFEASLSALSNVTQQLDGHQCPYRFCLDKCGMVPLQCEGGHPAILWNDKAYG